MSVVENGMKGTWIIIYSIWKRETNDEQSPPKKFAENQFDLLSKN
jgi:hypothetical protein